MSAHDLRSVIKDEPPGERPTTDVLEHNAADDTNTFEAPQTRIEDKMSDNTQNECTIADISDSALDNRFKPVDTAREFAGKSEIIISGLDGLARVHPFIASESYSSFKPVDTAREFAGKSGFLISRLDELARVHPFIAVPVLVFKSVITLELTRRDTNKKVLAVVIEMQDMMSALLLLRDIGPDGTTLLERVSGLMKEVADDMRRCANACDVYMKKSSFGKMVMKSRDFELRLADYVMKFRDYKANITFMLTMHTTLPIETVVPIIKEEFFRSLDTPQERAVQKFIDESGGAKAVVNDNATLLELVTRSGKDLASFDPTRMGDSGLASANLKKAVDKELAEDVDEPLEKNMPLFDRKLNLQSKQLVILTRELEDMMRKKVMTDSLERQNPPPTRRSPDTTEATARSAAVELPASQARFDEVEDKMSEPVNKVNDAYETLKAFYAENKSTIDSAGRALEKDFKSIDTAITNFYETSAVLVKGLDTLAQVHPFVGVAVLAFKLVITLDRSRRENNKKVLAVKIQMQDMVSVLFQLRGMRDPQVEGPDGTKLEDRMSGLMKTIADDINTCANACDLYLKKSFLGKLLKSKIYEQRLAGYAGTFDKHKEAVRFALDVHTAIRADAADKKLDGLGVKLEQMQNEMEKRMGELFRRLDTPHERDVQNFIDKSDGAKACVDNDATLRELVTMSGDSFMSTDPTHTGDIDLASLKALLNEELAQDVDKAFKENMKDFRHELEMQSKQLAGEIISARDQIISVFSDGAHRSIQDSDMQEIWKGQGWKDRVEAHTFVLLVKSYYTEKFYASDITVTEQTVSPPSSDPTSWVLSPTSPSAVAQLPKPKDEQWLLDYIRVASVQPLIEAVDTDETGLITIHEANDFTERRPPGWSLPMWVVFWSVGWHTSVTWYKNRIYKILAAMMSLMDRVKLANLQAADRYFAGPEIQRVELLLRSTHSAERSACNDARLRALADEFQNAEAERFEVGLKQLLYELDDVATIPLVTKTQRAERYVYPLLYQLLKCHFDILRLACVHILDESEFHMMSTSLAIVFQAVDERIKDLEKVFKSHSLNVKERLGQFAFGMFQQTYGGYKRDPINNTIRTFKEESDFKDLHEDLGPESDDDEETAKIIFAQIDNGVLRYGTKDDSSNVAESELQNAVAYDRKCAACLSNIYNTRLFCIECMDDRYFDTIDLCSRCSEQTPEYNGFVHKRSHLVIKTCRRIHDGDMAWIVPKAKVVATRVKEAFKAHSLHAAPMPSGQQICSSCGKSVSPPCWVCIDTACDMNTYFCTDCDVRRTTTLLKMASPKHKLAHPLVQIFDSELISLPVMTDVSISTLDTKMTDLRKKLDGLEEKLETKIVSLQEILERRFASLEAILTSAATVHI